MQDPKSIADHQRPKPSTTTSPRKRFWQQRARSFLFAFKGIVYAFKTEHNMWLHSAAAVLAILLGIFLHIGGWQWCIILICIAMVLALEIINTAIEHLADSLHPGWDPQIGLVKDLAAAAVLVAAVISLIIGCWIFGPALIAML
jgi:diacylglycerol kinase